MSGVCQVAERTADNPESRVQIPESSVARLPTERVARVSTVEHLRLQDGAGAGTLVILNCRLSIRDRPRLRTGNTTTS